MNRKLHRSMAAPAAAVLGLGVVMLAGSGIARAASAPDDIVRYGDLNTGTAAGVQELSDRVHRVAFDYCLKAAPPDTGPGRIENVRCQQAVIDEALDRINNPMLTRLFPGAHDDDAWGSG